MERPDARASSWILSHSQDVPLGPCQGTGLDGGASKARREASPVGSGSFAPVGEGVPVSPPAWGSFLSLTWTNCLPDRPALRLGGSESLQTLFPSFLYCTGVPALSESCVVRGERVRVPLVLFCSCWVFFFMFIIIINYFANRCIFRYHL